MAMPQTQTQARAWAERAGELIAAAPGRVELATYLAAYLAVACLGRLVIPDLSHSETIWPALGVYLAGLMRREPGQWPVLVGISVCADFILSLWLYELTPLRSGLLALENTAEALTGAYLLYRFGGARIQVHTVADVLILMLATCVAAPAVGTAIDLAFAPFVGGESADGILRRLTDDILPALIVAPLAVSSLNLKLKPADLSWRRMAEALALLAGLAIVSTYALGDQAPGLFLTIPLVIWAGKRFGMLGASAASMFIAVTALNFLAAGRGPFAVASAVDAASAAHISLNLYLGVVASVGLLLAGVVNEREDALHLLRDARAQLENTVIERTSQLHDAREQLWVAAEAVGFGTWEYDAKSARVHFSEQAARLMGVPVGEALSLDDVLRGVAAEDKELFGRAIERFLDPAGPREVAFEFRAALPGGTMRWISNKWRWAAEGPQGRSGHAFGALMDITERKQLEAALQERQAAVERERLQAVLLSSVSHDLRTPIATILASATSLQIHDGVFSPELRRDMYQEIVEGSQRLDRYVANLLGMTRLQSGALDAQWSPIDPAEIIQAALFYVGPRLGGRSVEQNLSSKGGLILVNQVLMEQALVNVLENAIAYSPAGTAIRVGTDMIGDEMVLSVEDEGPGIAPDELELVFEKFFRGRTDRRRLFGVGLGLSVARGFVELFLGSIRATSPIRGGRGTRMEIRLPAHDRNIP